MNALNVTILNIAYANLLDAEIGRQSDGTYALYIEVEDSETIDLFDQFTDRIIPDEDMIVIALY
jgi:predicted nucleotidyltransferase